MKVPFVGPTYTSRSLNADAQECLNCYPEFDTTSQRAPVALYGTPGTVLYTTVGNGPHRGIAQLGSAAVVVSGSEVYYLSGTTATLLGSITTSSGRVGIVSNGTQTLIVDGTLGWLATSSTLTQITDVDFPNGVTQAAYIANFFVVTGNGTNSFYWSENAGSGSAWNGLDFASAEGSPDLTVGVIVNQLEVFLSGSRSMEIWILSGDSNFLTRSGNTFIETGTVSAWTLAKLDSSVFWLGQDDRGTGIVWRANGYVPDRISNHAMEAEIQAYTTLDDAFAFTYQQEGHGFYVLTFPTEGKTWVYDVATQMWHKRAYRNPSTGELTRWRPATYCYIGGKHLVGDFEDGRLYYLDLDTYTDDGDPILRRRRTQCMDSPNGYRNFYQSLQVDMETGVGLATGQGSDPLLMMRYSNDGGHTWSNEKTKSVGKVGEYGARVKFGPTGAGRNRVWEISMTDPVKFAVFGAYLNAGEGSV